MSGARDLDLWVICALWDTFVGGVCGEREECGGAGNLGKRGRGPFDVASLMVVAVNTQRLKAKLVILDNQGSGKVAA